MLKHSSGYTLKKVGNSWYLLPFGQQVADQHKAVVLNETGAFLWNTLEHTSDLEELTHHLARYYEVPESTCPELQEDVQTFSGSFSPLGFSRKTWLRSVGTIRLTWRLRACSCV